MIRNGFIDDVVLSVSNVNCIGPQELLYALPLGLGKSSGIYLYILLLKTWVHQFICFYHFSMPFLDVMLFRRSVDEVRDQRKTYGKFVLLLPSCSVNCHKIQNYYETQLWKTLKDLYYCHLAYIFTQQN